MNPMTAVEPGDCARTTQTNDPEQLRRHRAGRLFSAWGTAAPSKIATLLVQAIAVPIVYRSLGPAQFAGYAAVTAVVSIFNFLNLGMGGALVTPLAQAVADEDREREAGLLRSALFPLVALTFTGLLIALPVLLLLSPRALFGLAATATSGPAIRVASVLACIGTLAAIPLSVFESVRQAYQELHINNLLNGLSNGILCLGLLLASWIEPTLPAFVAVTVLGPLAARILNALLLFRKRSYLFNVSQSFSWLQTRRLVRDGLSYVGAVGIGNLLIYQWPVYYMARTRAPLESSSFAVLVQLIIFILAFGTSFALPLWGAIADAVARGDYRWIKTVVRRARLASLVYGFCGLLALGFSTNAILTLWLHRPFHTGGALCWLAGFYVFAAMWENIHWPLALGLGAMRPASSAVFWRAIAFAVSVPLVISYGAPGLMVALSVSVIALTAWYYPVLLGRVLVRQRMIKEI
jgi:O-antigen/teichoic acid export membrane protein